MNLLNADSREDQLVNVNYGSTELAVTPTKEWQRLDNELESLMAAFAMNPRFHLSKTLDQMDDHVILTLVVQASIMECEGLSTPPSIVFRLHHDLGSLRTETYVFVKENFFSRKGKEVQLRLRYDEAAATSYETSFSTNFSSVFIKNGYEPLLKLGVYDRLRLQINTTRGNPVFSIFDIYAARPAFDFFFNIIFGNRFHDVCQLHPEIVNHILLCGPKNIVLKKRALSDLGFYKGPMDTSKPPELYHAALGYAHARHAGELHGWIEKGTHRINYPWHSQL